MDIANYLLSRPDYEFFVFTLKFYPQKMLPVIDDSRFHIHVLPSGENDLTDVDCDRIVEQVKSCDINVVVLIGHHVDIAHRLRESGCATIFANHGMPFWEVRHKRMTASRHKSLLKQLEYHTIFFIKYHLLHTYDKRMDRIYAHDIAVNDAYTVLCEPYRTDIASIISTRSAALMGPVRNCRLCRRMEAARRLSAESSLSTKDSRGRRLDRKGAK